ncbi:MAG: ABC transporter permease subunit [Acidimicrobiia bacterium]|nr:ABC transporter permease subunit [Acidimicrobiia bacterium]
MRLDRVLTVARIDLRRLLKSRDYWIPMSLLAGLFFVVVPFVMLSVVTSASGTANELVGQIGGVLDALPGPVQENIQGATPQARAAYAFAVYLLAPVAIIVPLTISSAVAAQTLVGERERGTGEFFAHSPLTEREMYLGKLISSLVPGFFATAIGFGAYSLIVNLRVGPEFGGWFFPTAGWWLLIVWVVPPFIAIALSVILWVSSRVTSTAAAQQAASLVSLPVIVASYAVSSGLLFDPTLAALLIGSVAWIIAVIGLISGSNALQRERLLSVGID